MIMSYDQIRIGFSGAQTKLFSVRTQRLGKDHKDKKMDMQDYRMAVEEQKKAIQNHQKATQQVAHGRTRPKMAVKA